MMENPLEITTIIPTFRRPQLLRRAIKSVLGQSYPHFQIYVCDNASGDETAKIVNQLMKHDSRIHYFPQETNIGMVKNFQSGLSRVNTPFFSFLADDDFLLPRFFETAIERLEQHPQAGFFAGSSVVWEEKSNSIRHVSSSKCEKEECITLEDFFPFMEDQDDFPNWTSMIFRREVLSTIGMLDEEIEGVDIDYIFRVLARFPCVISKAPASVFLVHENSYPKKFEFALRCSLEKIFPKLNDLGVSLGLQEKIIQCLQDYEFHALVRLEIKMLLKKEWEEAKKVSEFLRKNFPGKKTAVFFLMNFFRVLVKIPLFDRFFYCLLKMKKALHKLNRPEKFHVLEREIIAWKKTIEN
jgi:glycosyltransferase involved in cell wall biosynthesis